jgi:hypothetical protein
MTTPTSHPDRRDPGQGVPALQWALGCVPQHVEAIEAANRLFGCVRQALHRVYPDSGVHPFSLRGTGAPLAVGGAMAVYKLTVQCGRNAFPLVCKIPHQRRLVYTANADLQAQDDATSDLLDTLADLAETLNRRAAGVFPRCGGVWHWRDDAGVPRHLLIEAFIPGVSVERLLLQYEQRLLAGELDADACAQRRADAERLAVATYVRLWDALGRRRFTSDPSPWNVLVRDADAAGDGGGSATIIDLHSLQEDADFPYVVQRLAAVYGLREEVLERALLPGIVKALGQEEGRRLLLDSLPCLEAAAATARRNLGVDTLQPLLRLIRRSL